MHSIRSGHCSYRDYQLAYEVHGPAQASDRTILLVHGVLLDAYVNRDIAGALVKAGYQVVLLDLLGHGRSDAPADAHQYRLERFAEQVLTALDHLQLESVILGGISLGIVVVLMVFALVTPAQRSEIVLRLEAADAPAAG